ncbi:MAG TPA: response regulator [Desulfatiglandales bacterium]|nr:response regulator [Desulfatiglandales bacterium]
MIRRVLIVDDDREMLLSLKEGLERYFESFRVLTAEDGMIAMEMLKKKTVSLVVSDLKMPRMDGFSLLAHIMEYYPDIPVVIITGYSTPEMERLAREGGAVGYIGKPFMIEDLARKIMATLRHESEGGTLHSVSSGMFLQLIEMEQKTCTIRLVDKASGNRGVLFFRDGELFDARVGSLQGEAATYRIFSWDEVNLSIQNACPQKEKKIQADLQAILLDAARLKDEADEETKPATVVEEREGPEDTSKTEQKSEGSDSTEGIKVRLEKQMGTMRGVEAIYHDRSWNGLIAQASRLGRFFNIGELKLAYIDRGEPNDFIVLPDKENTVVSVNPRCPRDKIMKAISEEMVSR